MASDARKSNEGGCPACGITSSNLEFLSYCLLCSNTMKRHPTDPSPSFPSCVKLNYPYVPRQPVQLELPLGS